MKPVNINLIEDTPVKSLIKHLDGLLEQAKSGELQALAYVCTYRGNTVNSGWTKLRNVRRVVGEMESMKIKLLTEE